MQSDLFIQTPKSLEGIIDALEGVDCEEAVKRRIIEDIRERNLHNRIINEYRVLMKKKENWGRSAQIKIELSERYYKTPRKADHIHDIIYRKYKPT